MSDRVLGIIPARGGSKRVPNKNIKEIAGLPMIVHSIRDGEGAKNLNKVIISTDDKEIASIARDHGGNVPFMRPEYLSTDRASTDAVISHALNWATDHYGSFDCVCLLQVTNPLRESKDIDNALDRLWDTNAQSVVSMSEYLSPPQWAVIEDESERIDPYFGSSILWDDTYIRSQDDDRLYHPNGAVFAATTSAWETFESFYTPETVGYKMPPERSFDIDEPWELDLVRKLMGTNC